MGAVNTFLDWFFTFVTGFLGNVLAGDFCATAPMTSMKLIEAAAARLPVSIRDRYLEEWRADVDAQQGAIRKVVWALGCFISAYRLRRETFRDRVRRVSHELVLPSGERIVINMATLAFMSVTVRNKRYARRLHLPRAVSGLFVVLSKPFVDWQWQQPADLFTALETLQKPFPRKMVTRLDGQVIHETDFGDT
jgi:hypothetical protein